MTENFAALNLRPEFAQAVTLGYTQPFQRDIIPLMLAGAADREAQPAR